MVPTDLPRPSHNRNGLIFLKSLHWPLEFRIVGFSLQVAQAKMLSLHMSDSRKSFPILIQVLFFESHDHDFRDENRLKYTRYTSRV